MRVRDVVSSTLAFGGLPRLFFGGEGMRSTLVLRSVTEKGEARVGGLYAAVPERLDRFRLSLTGDTGLTAGREGVSEVSPVSHMPELVRLINPFSDV